MGKKKRSKKSDGVADGGMPSATSAKPTPPPHKAPVGGRAAAAVAPPRPPPMGLQVSQIVTFEGRADHDDETAQACCDVVEARALRQKYHGISCTRLEPSHEARLAKGLAVTFSMSSGVAKLADAEGAPIDMALPDLASMVEDFGRLCAITSSGALRTLSHQRLARLETMFDLHVAMNHQAEDMEQEAGDVDFFTVPKVDNHVHLAAAFHAERFAKFIKQKAVDEGHVEVVSGKTLSEVIEDAGLMRGVSNVKDIKIPVDKLDVLADYTTFARFDRFNSK